MESHQDLTSLREDLEKELGFHEAEVKRLNKALEALGTVEIYLQKTPSQSMIPGAGDYADLGPSELVLAIVNSQDKSWTMA